jgi:hypothetical protein
VRRGKDQQLAAKRPKPAWAHAETLVVTRFLAIAKGQGAWGIIEVNQFLSIVNETRSFQVQIRTALSEAKPIVITSKHLKDRKNKKAHAKLKIVPNESGVSGDTYPLSDATTVGTKILVVYQTLLAVAVPIRHKLGSMQDSRKGTSHSFKF